MGGDIIDCLSTGVFQTLKHRPASSAAWWHPEAS